MGYTVTERVGEDGMVHLRVEGAKPGEIVRVSINREPEATRLKPDVFGIHRDRFTIREDFDDPIPGMEAYECGLTCSTPTPTCG